MKRLIAIVAFLTCILCMHAGSFDYTYYVTKCKVSVYPTGAGKIYFLDEGVAGGSDKLTRFTKGTKSEYRSNAIYGYCDDGYLFVGLSKDKKNIDKYLGGDGIDEKNTLRGGVPAPAYGTDYVDQLEPLGASEPYITSYAIFSSVAAKPQNKLQCEVKVSPLVAKPGEKVTLTAVPKYGYTFKGWKKLGEEQFFSTSPTITVSSKTGQWYIAYTSVTDDNATANSTTTTKQVSSTSTTSTGSKYVDLGLSVRWATCNVGASSPTQRGSRLTYAQAQPYHLPTKAQVQELMKCSWTTIMENGYMVYVITGPNGNKLYLPSSGIEDTANTSIKVSDFAYYWIQQSEVMRWFDHKGNRKNGFFTGNKDFKYSVREVAP